MKKVFKILGIALGVIVVIIIGVIIYFNSAYPDVENAKNITVTITPEKIERGKYLANNVMVCMDCHSERDWTKYAGPVIKGTEGKGGEKFEEEGIPGVLYVRNITPAKKTGIGNWTDGELMRAITNGVNKDGEALFPMMPYQNYNKITQEDLEAVVSYVRSLKPIENEVPPTEINFPLSLIMKTIPIHTYTPSKPVDKSNSVKYGEYLVTMASCKFCHTQSDEGEPLPGMELAGGSPFVFPAGTIYSANITPDNETGIGTWSKEKFISTFKNFESDSARNIPADIKTEFNTPMPWLMYAGMTEEDLGAIYDYLKTAKAVKNKVTKFVPKNDQFANKK
jgi:hypothetical protein